MEKIRVSSKCGFLAVASVLLLAVCISGCGAVSSSTGTTTPPGVSIALSTAPSSTMAAAATATVAATVSNDSASGGVDWSCSPAGSCGSFSPTHTASGASTTYTAPATAGSVTITATSTSNHAAVASATITVSAPTTAAGALTSGNFVFTVAGVNSKKISYSLAGSVALDANGNVTAGVQDYTSHDGPKSPQPQGDAITGGKLTTSSNGKGTLTLITNNTAVGVGGTETFSVAVVNSKHAVISEFDGSASSSGSIDLQTLPSGSARGLFTFVVSGQASGVLEVFGGNITTDGAGNLSIRIDQNKGGKPTSGRNVGTYTAPDAATGRGTMSFGGDNFRYYVVNAKVFRLTVIDEDNTDIGSAYAGVTGITNAALNKQFVFADSSNLSPGALLAAAGLLTADGNGNITGFADVDENGIATHGPLTGTYSFTDTNGFGSITLTPNGNLQDVSVLGLYLTDPTINFSDPNSPADAGLCGLLIDLDTKIVGSGVLILPGPGITAPSGSFTLSMQTSNTNNEADAVGVVTISAGGGLTGTDDINDLFQTLSTTALDTAVAINGTIALDPVTPGRFTLPLAVTIGATPPTFNYVLYPASNTQFIVLEIDKPQYGVGTLQKQQ